MIRLIARCAAIAVTALSVSAQAQQPSAPRATRAPMFGEPAIVSPEILTDGRVQFRIRAPSATRVVIPGGEFSDAVPPQSATPSIERPAAGLPRPAPPPPALLLSKGADGVWSGTTARAVTPGAYRYLFEVDGVAVADQGNKRVSPGQGKVSSVLIVPGDFSEERAVPHGAISEIPYEAKSYGKDVFRRLWVYTPPGYERATRSYPVLYLLHGGGDSAEGWSTAGRANFILDNLLAQGKAVPFIVVMMSGWTPQGPQAEMIDAKEDPFNAEFTRDIIPMVEARYRVRTDPANRGLAGLSMGGFQTLTLGMKNLDRLGYVLPMSTGWFNDSDRAAFVRANGAALRRADGQLRLFRWGYGTTDIARENGLNSIAALRAAGVRQIETVEYPGGHGWVVWRALLHDYAQRIFK